VDTEIEMTCRSAVWSSLGSWTSASKGFFSFASAESLEEEVFILMEIWNQGYNEVLDIPWSRRYRLFRKKEELERRRQQEQRAAASRTRAKR
jgi:hypothetical protein